jgi:hypothetical protein
MTVLAIDPASIALAVDRRLAAPANPVSCESAALSPKCLPTARIGEDSKRAALMLSWRNTRPAPAVV